MGIFEDHLYNGEYPYLTPEEFVTSRYGCAQAVDQDPEDDLIIDAIMDASLIMFYLTGRQFNGTTQTTISPYNRCYDCAPHRLTFGLWPVTDIIAVREEGEDKDPADYHIDEYRYLVKNNGEAFPRHHNWYAEAGGAYDTEEDGFVFEVTVEHGLPAPRLLKRATAALACSLYDMVAHDCENCDLPERVTNVSRQGVSWEVADFANLLERGGTGIYVVDLAVKVFNPNRLTSPSFVWTPDQERGTRRYTNLISASS